MGQEDSHFYEFGRFRLDAGERVLLRDSEFVPLTPKVFDILLALVERGGHVVEKDDLMKRIWPDTFVEEGNLTQNVSVLRKALGESPTGPKFIETIARRGYRFVEPIREAGNGGSSASLATPTVAGEPELQTGVEYLVEAMTPLAAAAKPLDADLDRSFQNGDTIPPATPVRRRSWLTAV